MQKLTSDQLYRYTKIDPKAFDDAGPDTIEFMERFHPRAYQSLNFGLHLKRNQNHIFIMGQSGVGRIGMTKAMLRRAALNKPMPHDVVLVSDFNESNKTQYLYFDAGQGHIFKSAIEEFIAQLKSQLPVIFDGHNYQLRSQQIENELLAKQEAALEDAFDLAESLSIEIQQTENSFVLYALIDGQRVRSADLKTQEEAVQRQFMQALDEVEAELNKGLTHFPFLQHEFMDAGKRLNTQVVNEHLLPLINALRMEFGKTDDIKNYLDSLQKAVVNKLHLFWDQNSEQVTSSQQTSMEELLAEQQGLAVFEVNLLVDHRGMEHAPVIYEQNVSMPKLFGYTINSATANATDTVSLAMNHQAGLLQKAHGGFLMLSVASLLKDPEIWSNLKAALMTKRMTFEIPSSSSVVPYHLPDFPINVTLVLLGQPSHFYALQEVDSQFDRLFKVQVEFETELERTHEHELVLAKKLAGEIEDWEDLPVDTSALERLIEYASRMAEHQNRLYTNKAILRDVLAEANAYARANQEGHVSRATIEATLQQKAFHTGLVEEYHHRAIVEQQVLVSTEGQKIGQVNGLTVVSFGKQSFGQPVRITAQASAGEDGVIDIETEVDMSGPIHSKGMLIISGFLRGRYMREKAHGFTASIVMEQTYDGIEGDSASSAELLALLSSISQVPLRQDLGVTGAINQFGEIQPIGGVNEKIEGFFKICQERGLTGKQGVIIPTANMCHLMLDIPVREAVERGEFHIYAMAHIDDALSLMTGLPAGKPNAFGQFPEGSLNYKIVTALEKLNEKEDKDDKDD
ncbi:Lon protease family protein [Thiosulfativibrio zosterae]|uniref:endopeptidase La n=1 Tax=Thiosulfativibrio zosterae TaxID=2675053 RepID=A0A6F8PNM6_9GAMM|nr:ATP-binding protein [Thiosulfativibrio zosterae]BBP43637.1 ATP-dependent protease [Thiosulfativibrio zosterae]